MQMIGGGVQLLPMGPADVEAAILSTKARAVAIMKRMSGPCGCADLATRAIDSEDADFGLRRL